MTQYRKMRRQARQARRSGLQPMMVINSGEPFPDTVGLLLLRGAWRYRSELAPLYVTVAVFVAAWWLHTTRPQWWGFILGISGAAAWVLAAFGARLGLSALIERLYAAITVFAAGAWTSAATALGPFASPLPHALAVGALILAVPWWAHRRRRAKVRVERKLQAWPEIARAIGLAGSQVMSATVDVWGWRARFRLARGQTITDVIAKIPAIESGLGTFRAAVRVYPTPDDLANRCEIRVLDMDPHAGSIPWPGPSVTSITQPIDMGPFEDAALCRILFMRRHGLFGGTTGSGKSGGLNVLVGNLVACRDVVIWGIDLKKGMELGPWASCIDRLATSPEQAIILLRDAVAVLEARAELLAAAGKRAWEISAEMPALVIIIDEYAELADDAPDAMPYTDSIARLGRAVAVTLIAATQRPTQKAMGQGAVRSQMDLRVCFRVRERKDVDLVLGQGMLAAGWNAHSLNAPGKFLVSAPEHQTPNRARAYLVTDQAVSDTAHRFAAQRPCLDEVSRAALESPRNYAATGPDDLADDPDAPASQAVTDDREAALLTALSQAPEEGASVVALVAQTGMSRRWIYYRLHELAATGIVVQTIRGHWRLATPDSDDE